MSSIKLQSFEDFAAASKATAEAKIQEEQKTARTESAYKFETLLSEFGVTSIKDLNEEDRGKFFAKLGASEVSESLAIIEEGTRSQVGKIKKNGKITSVYMHYDGYPDHMLPTIKKGYKDGKAVDLLLKKGGGSGLEADPSKINFYGDKATIAGDIKNLNKYISHADYNAGAEFIYLFDERDGEWYMVDVYGKQELVPAFESLFINEAFKPSKGNLRDAKKVAKFLEGFFTQHSALSSSNSFLGACRYLLSESLGDANFHSYKDPVSKALGGKISTIMVDIDNLGGMSIPVGKKTIMNLLDEHYSGLANAAGWSGIGIVEGMALFLDGFGYSQQAQKIADAFELIWANESVMNEGNAFLAARAKAIEENAEEFEFNGKTYPVVTEGNEFGAARAEAIAKGEKTFKVGDEEYPVEDVSKEDEENAEEFVEESTVTEDSLSGIEFGNDDGIHPTKFKPLVQSLKKNKVKMEVEKEEGDHGYPEVKLTGNRKDIEKVLADIWGPDSIEDHEDAYESVVTEAKSFSQSELESMAQVIADATAKVDKTKAKVANFEMLDTPGRIAGFYIHKATNKLGAPSRYWITDSGEVVKAFRYDTFGPEKGTIAEVGDKLADVVKTFKANESVVNEKAKETTEAEGRNWKVGTLDHPKFGKISTFQFMTNDKVWISLSTRQSLEDQDNFIITAGGGAYNTAWSLNDKDVKKMAKNLQELSLRLQNDSFMNLGKSGEGKYKGKDVKLKDYVDALEAWVELKDSLLSESVVTEAEVKSDEDFKEYAFSVLGKAFGDKFDEEKAQEVVDGLLSKHGDDYGAAVGALTASLG